MSNNKTKRAFVTAAEFLAEFSAEDRARIEARAKELIGEEMTLRDLRKARELTQVQIAEVLGIGQERVSRLEQNSDMLLSTLASYVEAMGGSLKLVVVFPNRAPVQLASLADAFGEKPGAPKPRRRKKRGQEAALS